MRIAVSFAGENRELVESVVRNIQAFFVDNKFNISNILYEQQPDKGVVFYDNDFSSELAGKDLINEFSKIYGKFDLIFGFIDTNYLSKLWTNVEQSIIKERLFNERYKSSFFIPIILDNSRLDFYPNYMGYIDGRNKNAEYISEIIIKKIKDESITSYLNYSNPTQLNDAVSSLCKDISICFNTEQSDNVDQRIFNLQKPQFEDDKKIIVTRQPFGMNIATIKFARQLVLAGNTFLKGNFLSDLIFYFKQNKFILINNSDTNDDINFIKEFDFFNELVAEVINEINVFLRG